MVFGGVALGAALHLHRSPPVPAMAGVLSIAVFVAVGQAAMPRAIWRRRTPG